MVATRIKPIKHHLSVASSALLAQMPTGSVAMEIENAWDIDNAILYYSEADDRIEVAKVISTVGGNVSHQDRVSLKAVLDTMSGATPSGAVKSSTPTFTGASGGDSGGTIESNASALAKFDDTRAGLTFTWTHIHENNIEMDYNASVSIENDYRSFGGAVTFNIESASKADKYTVGLATTFDEVFRVGGNNTPAGLTAIEDATFFGDGEKFTTDLVFGYSHVLNRRTIGQINLGFSVSDGYLTDPYKVFSIVDSNTGAPGKSYFEKRPDSRTRTSITTNINHQIYPGNDILHASYRYYTDDWEVDSHTLDFKYQFRLSRKTFIEPRIRLYHQTAAFFYQNQFFAVIENNPQFEDIPSTFPQFLSADYRLDELNSITTGLRYSTALGIEGVFRARLEYIVQTFDASEFDENKAIVLQVSYSKQF